MPYEGHRDILGLWAGDGGEGAKFWLAVLTEIKNRGTGDVCIVVCDGLKGLPEAITTVWEQAIVQTCGIHLLRNTFRYASRRYWDEMSRDLRPVYTAATEAAAGERFDEFAAKWGPRYPAIIRLWRSAWSEFVPFLDYDPEIRRVICSTDVIVKGSAGFGGFRLVEDGGAGMCSSRVIVPRSQGWPAGHRGADRLDAGRDHPRLGGAEHRSRRCRCARAGGAATRR